MAELAIPMSKAVGNLTLRIRIKGARIATLRIKLAGLVLRFAAFVAGTKIEIEMGGDFDEFTPTHRSYMMVGDLEVPRQASVLESSPLYVSNVHEWGQKVDVFLDGVRQDRVVSFDVDGGWIRVHKLGPDGEPFIQNDEIASEIRRGRIELLPRA
jgi:hypothetical protein